MSTIVFAGPSVFGLNHDTFDALEFRPPAAAGDILTAVKQGVRRIGLIDGFFGNHAAVWHKEILYAISEGVAIAGAASMGALRAAECEAFGMVGVGEVFQAYRNGERSSDADVAVTHAPPELAYRPVTIALVDAEATIESMDSILDQREMSRLLAAARQLHFSKRTWCSTVSAAGLPPVMATLLAESIVSVKKADALSLLTMLQRGELAPRPSNWLFQDTLFFRNMANAAAR